MKLHSNRAALAVWVLVVCLGGFVANLSSVSGWLVLAGVAVLPPIVMSWRWNSAESMSQSIQKALR